MFRALCALVCAAAAPQALSAEPVPFTKAWREQSFFRVNDNTYTPQGGALSVASNDAVSLLYTALPQSSWPLRRAMWRWAVEASVPPTDLSRKGGDDRNLSLYFLFLDPPEAARLGPKPGLRTLMTNRNARVLLYVWGGKDGRGALLPSPYLDGRGTTFVLRPAGTGTHAETVDLAADYARAFGGAPGALVGVAVSADSDDTNSEIRAQISDLVLE